MSRILEDMTEEELIRHIRNNPTIGCNSWEAARGELLRRATLRVSKEVAKFNRCSTWLAATMIVLTVVITVLTTVMLVRS